MLKTHRGRKGQSQVVCTFAMKYFIMFAHISTGGSVSKLRHSWRVEIFYSKGSNDHGLWMYFFFFSNSTQALLHNSVHFSIWKDPIIPLLLSPCKRAYCSIKCSFKIKKKNNKLRTKRRQSPDLFMLSSLCLLLSFHKNFFLLNSPYRCLFAHGLGHWTVPAHPGQWLSQVVTSQLNGKTCSNWTDSHESSKSL